ncbi:MAG: DHH family phosphoesterase [Candidatus Scalindua sp.]|nr:DHH family phosphoesterase [Candidatus Scalindua sp.]
MIQYFDVFNGDADGITALHQWRLADPVESTLITGVKRDISLLENIPAQKDQQLTVFDISLKSNREFLDAHLDLQNRITWFDHHQAGTPLPEHPCLTLHLDHAPNTCTSNIVNRLLEGKFLKWAVVGAFGDSLHELGAELAMKAGCTESETQELEELGTLINYNAYGDSIEDLHFSPLKVYLEMKNFVDPSDFCQSSQLCKDLRQGFKEDFSNLEDIPREDFQSDGAIFYLPDEKWARRLIGTYANQLSSQSPNRPHAILRKKGTGWLVSVRAPETNPVGADILCSSFETGGGRPKAAGINMLPDDQLPEFIDKFRCHFVT